MKRILALLVIGVCALGMTTAQSTVVILMDLDQMVAEAELIVEGRVVDVISRWADDQSTIYTYVTLDDLSIVHGEVDDNTLTLRFEGGEVGDSSVKVMGTPTFTPGDREFLFIRGNNVAASPVVGFFQARFQVIDGRIKDYSGLPIVQMRDGAFVKALDHANSSGEARSSGGVINAGVPVDGIFPYQEGAVDEEETQALQRQTGSPQETRRTAVSPPMTGDTGVSPGTPEPELHPSGTDENGTTLPPPVPVGGALLLPTTNKKVSVFLKPSEDTGERMSVEDFIIEIRARIHR